MVLLSLPFYGFAFSKSPFYVVCTLDLGGSRDFFLLFSPFLCSPVLAFLHCKFSTIKMLQGCVQLPSTYRVRLHVSILLGASLDSRGLISIISVCSYYLSYINYASECRTPVDQVSKMQCNFAKKLGLRYLAICL